MRSERRHELEQNMLADWLAHKIEAIKPYQNAILGVIILALVAVLGFTWMARQSQSREEAAWDEYQIAAQAEDAPGALDELADDYPKTGVADWARAVSADEHLAKGCRDLFVDKNAASDELTAAVNGYLSLKDCDVPLIRQRVNYGLGKAREALGELDKARESYEDVVAASPKGEDGKPKGVYGIAAQARLDDLDNYKTVELYAKFKDFEPGKAIDLSPLFPGGRPEFNPDTLKEGGDSLFSPTSPFGPAGDGGGDSSTPELPGAPAPGE